MGVVAVLHVAVEGPEADVEAEHLAGGAPEVAPGAEGHVGRVGAHLPHRADLDGNLGRSRKKDGAHGEHEDNPDMEIGERH